MPTTRKGYRMLPIIIYTIIAGFGLMMLYVGLNEAVAQRRLLSAAIPVDVRIIASDVQVSRSSDTDRRLLRDKSTTSYLPLVRFSYQVGGVLYESDLLRPTIIHQGHGSHESAASILAPYPVGALVSAWVDPATPDRAFLIREKSAGPIVFLVLGLLLPPIGWLASRWV